MPRQQVFRASHYRENSHEIENILLAFDYVPSGYDPLTQHMSEEELTNSMRQPLSKLPVQPL